MAIARHFAAWPSTSASKLLTNSSALLAAERSASAELRLTRASSSCDFCSTASISFVERSLRSARASAWIFAASSTKAKPAAGLDSRAFRRRSAASWSSCETRVLLEEILSTSLPSGRSIPRTDSCSSRASRDAASLSTCGSLRADARSIVSAAVAIASRSDARPEAPIATLRRSSCSDSSRLARANSIAPATR